MPAEAEFAEFVRTSARSLFGTAYLLTGTGHAAEELVQETLADLFPKWARVSSAHAPLAYVRRALVNRFVSASRGPRSRTEPVWELPEQAVDGDLSDRIADRALIWQLLGRLPERQRAAIVLRYLHDYDDAAIATSLDCRVATVRSLVSRGVAAMRDSDVLGRERSAP